MLATTTTNDGNAQPHATIDPDIVLAARADRVSVDPDRRPAARAAEVQPPRLDPEFRSAAAELAPSGERRGIGTWVVRTILVVLFGVCSAVAAAAWQSYGDQAQEMIAHWMPRISLVSSADRDTSATPAAPASQEATPAAVAAAPTQDAGPSATASVASPEQVQMLQSMTHDLAALSQQISDLKASIAQLKAGQDQMAREMARVAEAKPAERTADTRSFDPRAIEQTLRPRPAPRPVTAAVAPPPGAAVVPHRPRPSPPATSGAVPPPPAPMSLQSAPASQAAVDPDQPVVRPPMPVR
ncbi:hypothetical protein [Bradyrhizobium sp. HKCCYLS20291]|uniref:hypothetical protein n=1 Tax=Bradyrhizobium sp. HKCCYLS20291 TaxID=3420766 RepID=UPI003EBD5DFF